MSIKKLKLWLVVPMVLALAVLACGGTTTPTEEPTTAPKASAEAPKPTKAPKVTEAAAATKASQPTKAPKATKAAAAPFTLSDTPYVHASSAFSVNLPDGWEISEKQNGVFVKTTEAGAAIDISFINAGLELSEEQLNKYILANEANWFGTFTDYTAQEPESQSDGSMLILKTLVSDEGPQTVFSYYWQKGTVVYEADFWVNTDAYDAYLAGFVEVANTIQTDEAAGAEMPLYALTYTFTGPDDLFTFSIPYGWTYTQNKGDTVQVDTWKSPDSESMIENLTSDDGTTISKSSAAKVALELLKKYYAEDIKITDDEVQSDGSERLVWKSASGGYQGTTFFETRGTTFLMLTWTATDDYYDLYKPVWLKLLETYDVP